MNHIQNDKHTSQITHSILKEDSYHKSYQRLIAGILENEIHYWIYWVAQEMKIGNGNQN